MIGWGWGRWGQLSGLPPGLDVPFCIDLLPFFADAVRLAVGREVLGQLVVGDGAIKRGDQLEGGVQGVGVLKVAFKA